MEPLSRHNYEEWFMSYLDEQLTDEQLELLLDFLELNPDLKEELKGLSGITLTPTQDLFVDKSSLLKDKNDIPGISALDQLCIARMENDLSSEEARAFDERLLTDTGLQTAYNAFQNTRLKPQQSAVYPDKKGLQKKTVVFSPWLVAALSTAAVVMIGWFLWPNTPENQDTMVAKIETPSAMNQPANTNHQSVAPALAKENTTIARAVTKTPKQTHQQALTNNHDTSDQLASREFIPMKALPEKDLLIESSTFIAQNDLLSSSSYAYPVLRIPDPADGALTIPQFALQLFREKVLGQERQMVRETQFSVWEIAGAGVEKINAITGSEMKLNRTYDEQGDLLAVSFNSRLIDLESPVRTGNK